MDSKTTRWVWILSFAASLLVSAVLFCELSGFSLLPGAGGSLIDRSIVSKLILTLFAGSLLVNARNTLAVFAEVAATHRGLRSDPSSSRLKLVGDGLLGEHAARMHQIYGHAFEGDVSQDVSLGVMRSRLHRNEWFVQTASQLLLTLGLIGTVVGLAGSLDGLALTIQSMAAHGSDAAPAAAAPGQTEGSDFVVGLHGAVGGMSTAFGTTFFGAVLGGVFLKLLSHSTQQMAEDLVDEIEIVAETELVPLLRASGGEVSARRREMLAYMDQAVDKESRRLRAVAERIEAITEKFDVLADSMARAGSLS